uniref:Uncharacterized protein n=1 Tax=Lepeophtheirus salmonis TaxID=72036 RepID=A0A0K2UCU1_LEPSM
MLREGSTKENNMLLRPEVHLHNPWAWCIMANSMGFSSTGKQRWLNLNCPTIILLTIILLKMILSHNDNQNLHDDITTLILSAIILQ